MMNFDAKFELLIILGLLKRLDGSDTTSRAHRNLDLMAHESSAIAQSVCLPLMIFMPAP